MSAPIIISHLLLDCMPPYKLPPAGEPPLPVPPSFAELPSTSHGYGGQHVLYDLHKKEDAGNYKIAIGYFNLRRLIIIALIQFVQVALVSYRCALCSSTNVFHVTRLSIYIVKYYID
jgi:hypothetical protein